MVLLQVTMIMAFLSRDTDVSHVEFTECYCRPVAKVLCHVSNSKQTRREGCYDFFDLPILMNLNYHNC